MFGWLIQYVVNRCVIVNVSYFFWVVCGLVVDKQFILIDIFQDDLWCDIELFDYCDIECVFNFNSFGVFKEFGDVDVVEMKFKFY